MDLALNNLQRLTCYKTKPNQIKLLPNFGQPLKTIIKN